MGIANRRNNRLNVRRRTSPAMPNVVYGGFAEPLFSDGKYTYSLMHGQTHEQGSPGRTGIGIGKDLEVQRNEIVATPNKGSKEKSIKVYSNENMDGKSPARRVLDGENPDVAFKRQQMWKQVNGYNDDGTKKTMGGLSRKKDYGSKKKPYPKVKKKDFAGGHRSYPIPTKADAVDALRLAGLHGRSDVKAKVYRKYPELRKKSAMGTRKRINNRKGQYQDPNDPNAFYGLTPNSNQAPLSPPVEELSDYSNNSTDYKSNRKRMNRNGYMRNYRKKQHINDQPNRRKAPMGTRTRQYNRYVRKNKSNLDLQTLQKKAIRAGLLDKGYTGNEEETAAALNLVDPRFIHNGIVGSQPISAEEFQQGHEDFMKYLESERGEYYDPNLEVDASQPFISEEEWQKYQEEHPEKFNYTGSNTAKRRDETNQLKETDSNARLRSPLSYWEPYANLASNLAGTTGTFISARNEARNMKISPIANPTPIMKGNTKVGIGDELATIREGLASNIRNLSTNTGSSALMNQRRAAAFTTGQGLYRQAYQNKYNKEAELQNADITLQQSVHSENTKEANARNQQRTTERNARNKELHEAKQHAIAGYINGANQFFTGLSNITSANNTYAMQLAGKGVTPDNLKKKYGIRGIYR